MSALTAAEVRRHSSHSHFSAVFANSAADEDHDGHGQLFMSWVHTRGRLEKGSGDSGKDLVMLREGGFPQVVLSGAAGVSGAVFCPSGASFVVQTKDALLLGETADPATTCQWLKLRAGEAFTGSPTWVGEECVLFGVRGGQPKRDRLFCTTQKGAAHAPPTTARSGPLFVAEHGGALLSWDHSQATGAAAAAHAQVAVVHRLPNAMLAEVVLVSAAETGDNGHRPPAVCLAIECRLEYSRPLVGFLASGALLLRLNALPLEGGGHLRDAGALQALPKDAPNGARHGLWLVEDLEAPQLKPVHVLPGAAHGTYDVCSGSYGRPGTAEGFRMDPARSRVVVTARHTGADREGGLSYSDDLFQLQLREGALEAAAIETEAASGKGCKIPVAVGEASVVYHHRSPTESGDLWLAGQPAAGKQARRTMTMPLSLQRKLRAPAEVTILNEAAPSCAKPLPVHALVFTPEGDGPLQPLLWLHGGPMAQYSFDYNPLLSWLAGCGYLVLAPNFSGSTGSGLRFMNRVLAEGCGVSDLSDCLACAEYLKTEAARLEPRLDLSRGVAVGGHSWGGFLASMCMLQHKDGESVFSCGVSAAGIADWFVQQRHTEVRYYDYALMGGWVYEKDVAPRARAVSPTTNAGELRAPILILHGDKDIDVPFQQIPPFVEAAKRSPHPGATVEYHAYPGEGHGMSGTEAQADYLDRIKTFLRINLKPWDFTDNPHGEVSAY